MQKKHNSKPLSLCDYISLHGINKSHLARTIGMSVSTFKNKLSGNLPQYCFSLLEYELIIAQLRVMVVDFDRLQIDHF